jgi:hypothetical protein
LLRMAQARATQIVSDNIAPSISHPFGGRRATLRKPFPSISTSGLSSSHASIAIDCFTNTPTTSSTTFKGYDFSVGLVRAKSGLAVFYYRSHTSYVILSLQRKAVATPLSLVEKPNRRVFPAKDRPVIFSINCRTSGSGRLNRVLD